MTYIVLIVIAIVLEVLADILFKEWTIKNQNIILYTGLSIYFIGTYFWAMSLKYELLSKSIVIFSVINLICITLVGLLYYNEQLSLINKIAILFGILSVLLIEL
ncbi:MAG: SMR family transporter [Candidatus Paceibacterota bacterium]|jgi:multidrug transporter EmrE-like cation transporter